MTNGYANGVWKGALKNAVAAVSAIVIANLADHQGAVISLEWFKHVGIQSCSVILLNEARYWKNWAEGTNGKAAP